MKRGILIVVMSVLTIWTTAAQARDAAVIGEPSDTEIVEGTNSFTPNAASIRAGARPTSGNGGRSAVFVFQLPEIRQGEVIQTANFQANLEAIFTNVSGGLANADLYGLGWATGSTVEDLVGNTAALTAVKQIHYEKSEVDASFTRIEAGFVTVDTPLGPVHTDDTADAALAAWLQAQYDAGASAGDYVFLRVNPTANHFANDRGYEFSSADSIVPDIDKPRLTITTTIQVTGDPADGTLQAGNGALVDLPSPKTMQVGSRPDTYGGGTNAIFIFKLPELSVGQLLPAMDFRANLEEIRPSTSGSVDLYALGWAKSGTIESLVNNSGGRYVEPKKVFWESATVDPNSTLIQTGFANASSPLGMLHTNEAGDAALGTWIKAQYEAGAAAGDYVFLRLNPTVNTWANDRGWVFSSANSGVAAAKKPLLTTPQDTVLWRLGNLDPGAGSAAEFRDYHQANPEVVAVPTNWRTRTQWNTVLSKGLKASVNPAMKFTYDLASVPANGVELQVKIINAHRAIPQMAVFSNDIMVGMIQIAGVAGADSAYPYVKTYRLYIPKEFLQSGTNALRLEAPRSFSGSSAEDQYLWWVWDHLQLVALSAPATEPIHGRYIHLGTTVMQNGFDYNADVIRHLPAVLQWLGIAYSGNVVRAGFWSNTSSKWQADGLAYLQKLAEFNMQVVVDHLNTHPQDHNFQFFAADGTLKQAGRDKIDDFLDTYGDYIQYYEVDNEPGLFGSPLQANIDAAEYVQTATAALAPHVKVVAPGWAYANWANDPDNRQMVEQHCDLTGGHAYGPSYADPNDDGSSFVQNLLLYGEITDGLPKEMLVTETGNTHQHLDPLAFGTTQRNAASFDRILRGQVGYADHIMQHAAFFTGANGAEYKLFNNNFDWSTHDPLSTSRYSFGSGQRTRVEIFRRIACAYATHGTPLKYTYLDPSQVSGHMIYTRPVDTATLAPLPGSGATSDKVLINFVNFGNTTRSFTVRITMPSSGTWSGIRINGGDGGNTYGDARHDFSRSANPTMDVSPTLAPGEAVQLILSRE